jgi:hypothetical protein
MSVIVASLMEVCRPDGSEGIMHSAVMNYDV